MIYDPENPLPGTNKSDPETIERYFKEECFHVRAAIYCLVILEHREWSMLFIKQLSDRVCIHVRFHDPVVPFLAVTLFDNFVSSCEVPKKLRRLEKSSEFFITCCFIAAWRMRYPDFSMNENLNVSEEEMDEFTNKIVDILTRNRICMPPVTALCFLDYLIGLLKELDQFQMRCLKSFTSHKICALKYDIRLAEFQPSIMAAAALASSINTFYKEKLGYVINEFLHCNHLNKESLKYTIEMLIPDVTVCIPESPDNIPIPDIFYKLTIEQLLELRDIAQKQHLRLSDYESATDTAKTMPPLPDRIRLHRGPAPNILPHKKTAKKSGSGRKKRANQHNISQDKCGI